MTTFRKSRLSMALGVALGAAAMIPAVSLAAAVDANDRTLRSDDGGDALLYPVYAATFVDGNATVTAFSVTNTSPEKYIVAKVRFREQTRSMDALDFVVVLSPEDKFDFFVRPDTDGSNQGRPVVEWDDESCVIGPPLGAKKAPFPATSLARGITTSDLTLGHMEVIGMFAFDTSPWAQNCGEMRRIITDPDFDGTEFSDLQTSDIDADMDLDLIGQFDVPDDLIGRFIVRGVGRGVEVGGNATPVKDTFTGPFYAAQSDRSCWANDVNPGSNITHPCFGMYDWDAQWFDHPHLGDMLRPGLWNRFTVSENNPPSPLPRKIDSELRAYTLQGDWASSEANRVLTEWVVSFPTKYVYTDFQPNKAGNKVWVQVNPHNTPLLGGVVNGGQALSSEMSTQELVNAPFDTTSTYAWNNTTGPYTGNNCLNGNRWTFWDMDENPVTVVSPAGGEDPICNEVNFYTIRSISTETVGVPLFASTYAETVVVNDIIDGVATNRGWAELLLDWDRIEGRPLVYGWGAATIGLDVIQRATDDASQNNGTLSDLARRQNPGSPY